MIEFLVCLALSGKVEAYEKGSVGVIGIENTPFKRVVKSVWENSPADLAGIRVGDRILFVNGDKCGKIRGEPGTEVIITISRSGGVLKEFIIKRVDKRSFSSNTLLEGTKRIKDGDTKSK